MTILFYAPFYLRSRDTESLMIEFKKKGYDVLFLSQYKSGLIHEVLKEHGIPVYTYEFSSKYTIVWLLKHVWFLVRFCWTHKVNLVFSHLEPSNFVSVCAQCFIKSKVIINRHHVDELHLLNEHLSFSYWFTYRFAKKIITVSNRAKEFMIKNEKVSAKKINHINLLYDFSLYDTPNLNVCNELKKKYDTSFLLITACRIVKDKRPEFSIQVLEELLKKGVDCKLLILGDGPMLEELKTLVEEKQLNKKCFLIGRVNNIIDYLYISDVLLHPSILDSSSVIVKEAGLANLIPVVCHEVGDFDEYLINDFNAILVNKENFINEAVSFLIKYNEDRSLYINIGLNLNKDIIRLFSVDNNIHFYDQFLK